VSERLTKLAVQAFRGVPDELSIDFPRGRSALVLGDNGTGKSTIADALEWYFTGRLELLAHEGRGHALRHLGADPDLPTYVEIASTGSLGGRLLIGEAPSSDVEAVGHKETFLLRGRTLVDFINKTKAEKHRALVELLGLDRIDAFRLDLQRARNELKSSLKTAQNNLESASAALEARVPHVSDDGVLQAISELCTEAGVDCPDSFEKALDPAWTGSLTARDDRRGKAVLVNTLVEDMRALPVPEPDGATIQLWNDIVGPETRLAQSKTALFRAAEGILQQAEEVAECPLCGQAVKHEQFEAVVRNTLANLEVAATQFEQASSDLSTLLSGLQDAETRRRGLCKRAKQLDIALSVPPEAPESAIRKAMSEHAPITEKVVAEYAAALARWDEAAEKQVEAAQPEPPLPRERALVALGTLTEQARKWRSAREDHVRAKRAREVGETLLTTYQEHQRRYFEKILNRISSRVARIYERLHPGEGLKGVSVEPWTSKGIELSLEFYGVRQRPPHGVLSESHLNSLAVALFLAMAETFNQKVGFLVLDDVINSFDLEHRGHLAELLVEEFSGWQLIVLTHDAQFYEHLTRRAPDWTKVEFTSWTYEEGPRTARYETAGILAAARRCLRDGDTNAAAMKVRRCLEELLQEICHGLAAPLAFRRGVANDRREIGELFKGLRHALKERAKASYEELKPLLGALEADVQAVLNVEAHAGRGQASRAEVTTALQHVELLDTHWTCGRCNTRIWWAGTPEASRCKCGHSPFPPIPTAP
jgi:energy-coupling factor transporter ATP-binding protein EcfA2